MKKPTLILVILCNVFTFSFAQTTLTIIGTAHERTNHFTSDTLLQMLIKIKPDVILQELDTALMDSQGNYKGRATADKGNEHVASMAYKNLYPKVVFRQFDIEDRSFYYSRHNTFAMENKLSISVDSLFSNGLLSDRNLQIISSLYKINGELNTMYGMDIHILNSKKYMKLAASRQDWMYNRQLEVIGSTPALKQYYDFYKDDGDFWIRRNKAMIHNIASYLKEFKGKKIVVLTGATHKYFLTDGLSPLQSRLDFKLLDLPD